MLNRVKKYETNTSHANEHVALDQSVYFRDGVRRIDYILAFKTEDSVLDNMWNKQKNLKRAVFECSLIEEGLELEYEDKHMSQDGETTFIKVHAPWNVLTRYAENLKLKMPIKYEAGHEDETGRFNAVFSRSRLDHYLIPEDKSKFFSNGQRSRIVYEVLARAYYKKPNGLEDDGKIGITRLLKNQTYTAAFPLHDGPYHTTGKGLENNERYTLYTNWVLLKNVAKPQPLHLVRRYFGEKVGIYFAWAEYYTMALVPASFAGIMTFMIGVVLVFFDESVNSVCQPERKTYIGSLVMCPSCDVSCDFWHLGESCMYSQLTFLCDNFSTCFFAIFMSLWATFFLELWKRKQATVDYQWDIADFEAEEESFRPEFEAIVRHRRINMVTRELEPFVPLSEKVPKFVTSCITVFLLVVIVIGTIMGVIVYRAIISMLLNSSKENEVVRMAGLINSVTAGILSLLAISILNVIYGHVALRLTNFEMHRKQTEWEDHYTFKMFLFQSVNYYGTIFYVAFFKGRFVGRPGQYERLFGSRQEECNPSGCMVDLCIQLAIVMTGKQVLNSFTELFFPWVTKMYHAFRSTHIPDTTNNYTRWEQDYDLPDPPTFGLFQEYLELVIQFGFVTLFVAAFPLAPLFALLNNVIELRLDAYKFVCVWKRPMASRAQDIVPLRNLEPDDEENDDEMSERTVISSSQVSSADDDSTPSEPPVRERVSTKFSARTQYSDYNDDIQEHQQSLIGIWFMITEKVAQVATLSNAFIIAFTSDFVQKLVYINFVSNNYSLEGYVNWTLSTFNTSDFEANTLPQESRFNVTTCRYREFRHGQNENYQRSAHYWNLLAARLIFVLIFEHCVYILTWLVASSVPDVPTDIKVLQLRQAYLAKKALYKQQVERSQDKLRRRSMPPGNRLSGLSVHL